MFSFSLLNRMTPILRWLPATLPRRIEKHVARDLLEGAGARAGSNPQQARELRQAAFAYLSVVR